MINAAGESVPSSRLRCCRSSAVSGPSSHDHNSPVARCTKAVLQTVGAESSLPACLRLNQHQYHDCWLQNLLISASLGGYRRPAPQNQ